MTPDFKTLVPAKITSEPKEVRRWWISEWGGEVPGQEPWYEVSTDPSEGDIEVVEAIALTEAERTITILRDKQTQHESTLLETMRVRGEAERAVAELKGEVEKWKQKFQDYFEAACADYRKCAEERDNLRKEVERLKNQPIGQELFRSLNNTIDRLNTELMDAQKEATTLRAQVDVCKAALEVYAMTNETFPEYGDVARQTLVSIKGGPDGKV